MQKVVGSSPIIRSIRKAPETGSFSCLMVLTTRPRSGQWKEFWKEEGRAWGKDSADAIDEGLLFAMRAERAVDLRGHDLDGIFWLKRELERTARELDAEAAA